MDPNSTVQRCRAKAEECQQMAQGARDPKIKAELLDLAAQWSALAEGPQKDNDFAPHLLLLKAGV